MNIFSVIVTYNPKVNSLISLIDMLLEENVNVVVVDNTELSTLAHYLDMKAKVISYNANLGIAKAQNEGIAWARSHGADIIVFFDQDSRIEKNFISELTKPLVSTKPQVVAPVFFDIDKGYEYPSMRFNKIGLLKAIKRPEGELPFEVDVIISSGSAATVSTFDVVGVMDERYFIDYVDTEWSIRCKAKGVSIKVVPKAIMKHAIGEKSINFFIMRSFIHTPIRCYYKIRNSFIFLRNENVPLLMRVKEILMGFVHHTLLLLFVKNKMIYAKNYFIATLHGISGVTGKKP